MLVDEKITKIVGGGYEIAEVRYMDSVEWHKPTIVENPCEKSCQDCQSSCEITSQCGRSQGCYGQCRNNLCGNTQCVNTQCGNIQCRYDQNDS